MNTDIKTAVKPAQRLKRQVLTLPNILSLLRIALIPIFVTLYCVKNNYCATGCVLLLSGLTDVADGFIARHLNMCSDVGKILDPIADKLTQAAMLICLFLRYPLMLLPFLMMFIKELFMSVSGLIVIKKTGKVYSAKWHGKVATILLYGMMILHVFWYDIPAPVSYITIFICTAMVAISMVLYGSHNIGFIKEHKQLQKR